MSPPTPCSSIPVNGASAPNQGGINDPSRVTLNRAHMSSLYQRNTTSPSLALFPPRAMGMASHESRRRRSNDRDTTTQRQHLVDILEEALALAEEYRATSPRFQFDSFPLPDPSHYEAPSN